LIVKGGKFMMKRNTLSEKLIKMADAPSTVKPATDVPRMVD
jgi:hypothetical protein